ncbi:hypothetical protein [Cellulomonas sp. HZM]|uniref:hypothetical protein n=1 Tax=Cellulomonas sp. HZM TaxID=1454010 RepID=UPI0012DDB959|nr:hypothetical protein [Cellulomonas sp. HZM]
MTSVAEFKVALMESLEAGVDELVATDAPALHEDPAVLARRMLAAVPRAHLYDQLVGPFFDLEGVRRLLGGTSRQAVHDRVKRGTLLQVRTSDDVLLYPAFQFDGTDVSPRIRQVLIHLRDAGVDGWTIATWFSVPAADLDGDSPRTRLVDAGAPIEPVEQLAIAAARRWAAA